MKSIEIIDNLCIWQKYLYGPLAVPVVKLIHVMQLKEILIEGRLLFLRYILSNVLLVDLDLIH